MLTYFSKYIPWYTFTLSILILTSACQKEEDIIIENEEVADIQETPAYIVSQEIKDARNGEYIVSFNKEAAELQQALSSRSETAYKSELEKISLDMLTDIRLNEKNIKSFSVNRDFPSILLQNVSEEDISTLEMNGMVEEVRPNKVIAMSVPDILDPYFRSILVPATQAIAQTHNWYTVSSVGGYKDMSKSSKRVWVVDTGIDMDHPDLNINTELSRNFDQYSNSPDDELGHGTHVAGIIGAKDNSIGITGIAAGIEVIAIKVIGASGEGDEWQLIDALRYVRDNVRSGDIINISLGTEAHRTINAIVKDFDDYGAIVVVAAGNYGIDADEFSPAKVNRDGVYVVGALDSVLTDSPLFQIMEGMLVTDMYFPQELI